MIHEYHLSYDTDSPGELEDIEGRLRATNPLTLDAVPPTPPCDGDCWLPDVA